MKLELEHTELNSLVARQLGNLFIFDAATEQELLSGAIRSALEKCEHCFSRLENKYYSRDGEAYFNPFHSGQYSIFLYYLSRAVWDSGTGTAPATLADRIYYLNKTLNGLDLFYEVNMPDVFFLDHPVGTVIGRGTFGNGFSFGQNCTIGNNKGIYPTLGENVYLYSGGKIIGNCTIGDNVIIAANTYIKDQSVPENSIVFGSSPELVIKNRSQP
jgi:serine O-acetyltransferase